MGALPPSGATGGRERRQPHVQYKYREEAWHVARSQPGSASVFEPVPDGRWATRVEDREFTTYLQRQGSLYLSVAADAFDQREAAGAVVSVADRLGDKLCNSEWKSASKAFICFTSCLFGPGR